MVKVEGALEVRGAPMGEDIRVPDLIIRDVAEHLDRTDPWNIAIAISQDCETPPEADPRIVIFVGGGAVDAVHRKEAIWLVDSEVRHRSDKRAVGHQTVGLWHRFTWRQRDAILTNKAVAIVDHRENLLRALRGRPPERHCAAAACDVIPVLRIGKCLPAGAESRDVLEETVGASMDAEDRGVRIDGSVPSNDAADDVVIGLSREAHNGVGFCCGPAILGVEAFQDPPLVSVQAHGRAGELAIDQDPAIIERPDRDRLSAGATESRGVNAGIDHRVGASVGPVEETQCLARRGHSPEVLDPER